jgi:hypothetical protein
MRLATLAVLGLVIASGPAFAGGKRGGHQAHTSARTVQPAGQATRAAHRPGAAHQQAQVQRSAPLRGQLGMVRDARAASASTAISPRRGARGRAVPMRWSAGLPAPALVQANECPDGTMATLAHGHDDIVRCMPF